MPSATRTDAAVHALIAAAKADGLEIESIRLRATDGAEIVMHRGPRAKQLAHVDKLVSKGLPQWQAECEAFEAAALERLLATGLDEEEAYAAYQAELDVRTAGIGGAR